MPSSLCLSFSCYVYHNHYAYDLAWTSWPEQDKRTDTQTDTQTRRATELITSRIGGWQKR